MAVGYFDVVGDSVEHVGEIAPLVMLFLVMEPVLTVFRFSAAVAAFVANFPPVATGSVLAAVEVWDVGSGFSDVEDYHQYSPQLHCCQSQVLAALGDYYCCFGFCCCSSVVADSHSSPASAYLLHPRAKSSRGRVGFHLTDLCVAVAFDLKVIE